MAANVDSRPACIDFTRDSCFITLGYSYFNANDGDDFLLVKVNSYGDTVFCKQYGNGSIMEGEQLIEEADRSLLLFGNIYEKLLLLKTDSMGNMIWNKTYDDVSGFLYPSGFCKLPDGGFAMAAITIHSYVMVIRLDSVGNVMWTKIYFVNPTSCKISPNLDGGFLMAGNSSNSCYILKTDSTGNITWSKQIADYKLGEGNSLLLNNDGSILMTGGYNYSGVDYKTMLLKLDSSGNAVWYTIYGNLVNDMGYGVTNTYDNGYVICGTTLSSTTSAYPQDVSLIKTDSAGTCTWAKKYNMGFNDWAYIIKSTPDSGYVIAGGKGAWGMNNAPEQFILKTDGAGGSCIASSNLILTQASGTFVVANLVVVDSTINITTDTVSLQIQAQAFPNSKCYLSTDTREPLTRGEVSIYPNPFHEKFYVTATEKEIPKFELSDITGKQISFKQSEYSANVYEINVANVKPGILILKSGNATSVSYWKVVLY